MHILTLTVLLAFSSINVAAAHPHKAQAECAKVRQQIRRVQARLRAGYTARAGVRLEARLRELKKKRARVCR